MPELSAEWDKTPNDLRAQVLADKDRRKAELLKTKVVLQAPTSAKYPNRSKPTKPLG